jgi:hypothetical protein
VLRAAIDELLESGYAGLTMDRVAERAGTNKNAIYHRDGESSNGWAHAAVVPSRRHQLRVDFSERNAAVLDLARECDEFDVQTVRLPIGVSFDICRASHPGGESQRPTVGYNNQRATTLPQRASRGVALCRTHLIARKEVPNETHRLGGKIMTTLRPPLAGSNPARAPLR